MRFGAGASYLARHLGSCFRGAVLGGPRTVLHSASGRRSDRPGLPELWRTSAERLLGS